MEKCSFFNQIIIVYQSFCGTLLTSYFSLQGNVLCFCSRKSVTGKVFIAWSVQKTSSKKFYLWLYLTQIVHSKGKMLFLQVIVYQSFYCGLFTLSYFLLQRKVMCFGTHQQVTCEMFITFQRPCQNKRQLQTACGCWWWRLRALKEFIRNSFC